VAGDDVDHSKPDPDLIQTALDCVGARSRTALMLGDTPWDVLAAARANLGVVALRCGGSDDAALAGAVAIYDDAADLLERYERSPFVAGHEAFHE
jgi:phosphoglycolate phosphatase-like HAD superfamily hydrolase